MKKIFANLALLGSVLISAAVLAPLFYPFNAANWHLGMQSLMAPGRSIPMPGLTDFVTRENLATGLLSDPPTNMDGGCDGWVGQLACAVNGP